MSYFPLMREKVSVWTLILKLYVLHELFPINAGKKSPFGL